MLGEDRRTWSTRTDHRAQAMPRKSGSRNEQIHTAFWAFVLSSVRMLCPGSLLQGEAERPSGMAGRPGRSEIPQSPERDIC